MANKETYVSDKELTELYNNLDKGSLIKMLIEKHRQLEKQVKKLIIHNVSKCFKTELEMHEIATEKYHEHNYGDAKYDGFMECYRMLVKESKPKIDLCK